MTKLEKLILRFQSRPKNFKYSELKRMLSGFGYVELQGSGSRVVFFNDKIKHNIKLHRPHPENILKTYQVDLVLNELKSKDLI
ncbi:MAG: type II toxin-antitoxin system HicA family toxin [Bacteroidales bacterium]